jgi:hypothetical protein
LLFSATARGKATARLSALAETSMDAEFTVDLIKKKSIGWPRIENDTYVMVLGMSARCCRHSSTRRRRCCGCS